jgi:hypothetical protein
MKQHLSHHLSDDELLDRIYGLGENGLPHLRECEECSSRFQALERRRAEIATASSTANEAVSNEVLAAQRRAIYSRLGQAPAARLHWAPAALAVAFLLVTGVFLARPHLENRPVRSPDAASGVELRDEQLFSDLYSMEQSDEPRATAPLHALFEGSEGDVEQ